MCLPNILFPVFMFAFIFHCCSFSPCWPIAFLIFSPPLWMSMLLFQRNSFPLFSITRSSSFFVIHVRVNINNNAEKDTTLLLFLLSKSPGDHVISFQIKPWVAFGSPYLLIELFYIGMPMVRTDGRASGRSVSVNLVPKALFPGFGGGAGKRGRVWVGVPSRDYQISRMGRLQHFLSYGAPLAPRVELRYYVIAQSRPRF